MLSLVRRIDHVYAILRDAEGAHRFLHDQVGLPVAWPFVDYGAFASGGINLGNLNLEFVAPRGNARASAPARITAIALEPAVSTADLLRGLDERAIAHSEPMPTPGWTNVGIEGFPAQAMVFFCDYHFPAAKDHRVRQDALDATGGGRLGVRRAKELIVGAAEMATVAPFWARLLAPSQPDEEMRWSMQSGVALRVTPAEADGIRELVIDVAIPDAADVWERIDGPARVEGLALSFVST